VLEAVGGFDERIPVAGGEDTDLAMRGLAAGAPYVAAPEMLTHHAVDTFTIPALIRLSWRKWQYLPLVVKRHPQLRELVYWRYFWRASHAWLVLALGLLAVSRRRRLVPLLFLPYVLAVMPERGAMRGRLRALIETPAAVAVDLTEAATLARGSVKHRSLLL
jgi:GT2 family glycosyltransferase